MKLIIESGATKGDWRIIDKDGQQLKRYLASGTNVSTMTMRAIEDVIGGVCHQMAADGIAPKEIYLYTAGVITEEITASLRAIFRGHIPQAQVNVFDDLTAAARAVCGHEAGIAAILGTGSNSCQYDGQKIIKRVYSGGFILGDEGSAATLGKFFIADFLKGFIPEEIAKEFSQRHKSDYSTIVECVYRSSASPSGYLGSLAPFILEHYDHPYIKALVDDNFRGFIRRSLKQYDIDQYAVGVVGGFGNALQEIFTNIATQEGVKISRFVAKPIEELIKYHTT